jgi:hypothetical protein
MKNATIGLLAAVSLAVPAVAFAQSNDQTYCQKLVNEYQTYLDQSQKRGEEPQGVDAKIGVERCKAGDVSGIPAIEKALQNAKIDLPARG